MATEYDLITRYEGVYSKEEQERIIEGVNKLEEGGYLFDKQDNKHLEDHKTINLTAGGDYCLDLPSAGPLAQRILRKLQPCVNHYLERFSVLGKSKFLFLRWITPVNVSASSIASSLIFSVKSIKS